MTSEHRPGAVNSDRGAVNSRWIWETPNTYLLPDLPQRRAHHVAARDVVRPRSVRGVARERADHGGAVFRVWGLGFRGGTWVSLL